MEVKLEREVLAGAWWLGFRDGDAKQALFKGIRQICFDAAGNVVIADCDNHRIRRLDLKTMRVSTLAGRGEFGFADGPADKAKFNYPTALCCDEQGNVFVCDSWNKRIRRIDAKTRVVSTVAGNGKEGHVDGLAANASFKCSQSIVYRDSRLYVSDEHSIRCIELPAGTVSTIAGSDDKGFRDGKLSESLFNFLRHLAFDNTGRLIVVDDDNNRIRCVDLRAGTVSTVAAIDADRDGKATEAAIDYPYSVICDPSGVIFCCTWNGRVACIIGDSVMTIPGVEARGGQFDQHGDFIGYTGKQILRYCGARNAWMWATITSCHGAFKVACLCEQTQPGFDAKQAFSLFERAAAANHPLAMAALVPHLLTEPARALRRQVFAAPDHSFEYHSAHTWLQHASCLTELTRVSDAWFAQPPGDPSTWLPRMHTLSCRVADPRSVNPAHLLALPALTHLDLSHCGLSSLPAEFAQLTELKRLELTANKLDALPECLLALQALEHLDLQRNQLRDLPWSLGLLPLKELLVLDNPLSEALRRLSALNDSGTALLQYLREGARETVKITRFRIVTLGDCSLVAVLIVLQATDVQANRQCCEICSDNRLSEQLFSWTTSM